MSPTPSNGITRLTAVRLLQLGWRSIHRNQVLLFSLGYLGQQIKQCYGGICLQKNRFTKEENTRPGTQLQSQMPLVVLTLRN